MSPPAPNTGRGDWIPEVSDRANSPDTAGDRPNGPAGPPEPTNRGRKEHQAQRNFLWEPPRGMSSRGIPEGGSIHTLLFRCSTALPAMIVGSVAQSSAAPRLLCGS